MSQQSDSITPWFCEVKPTYCSNICLLCRKEQKHIVLTQQTCNNPNQQQVTKVLTISWVHKAQVKHSNPHFLLNSTFTVFLYSSFPFLSFIPILSSNTVCFPHHHPKTICIRSMFECPGRKDWRDQCRAGLSSMTQFPYRPWTLLFGMFQQMHQNMRWQKRMANFQLRENEVGWENNTFKTPDGR